MGKLTDQLFGKSVQETEKEFSFAEFLDLVDPYNGILTHSKRQT